MAGGKSRSRVVSALSDQCWAILPGGYDLVAEVAFRWARGEILAPKERQAAIEAARRPTPMAPAGGKIALINVFGPISPRMNALSEISDCSSCEEIKTSLLTAKADPQCVAAALNFHTPGGSVYGVTELADLIFSMRGSFPVWGISDYQCGSLGLWLLSQCERAYADPDSDTGGLGVLTSHDDLTDAAMKEGRKTVFVSAPEDGFKVEDRGPMTPELRSYLQGRVDETYVAFAGTVARGRKLSVAKVRDTFGKGRMLSAETASSVGMVDGVRTLTDMMDEMMGRSAKASRSQVAVPRGAPAAAKKGKAMADNETEGGSPPDQTAALRQMLTDFSASVATSVQSAVNAATAPLTERVAQVAAENTRLAEQVTRTQVEAANAARLAQTRSRLEGLQARGIVASGEIDAELSELMELSAASADARLARLSASAPRIPQRRQFMITGQAGAQVPVETLLPPSGAHEEEFDMSPRNMQALASYGEILTASGIPTSPSTPFTPEQRAIVAQQLEARGAFNRYFQRSN